MGAINRNLALNSSLSIGSTTIPGIGNVFDDEMHRGRKQYELSNHLGNVLTTVSDKKLPHSNGTSVDYYLADIVSEQDYTPFGMLMVGRVNSAGKYRYGFNGKENDNEVKGVGNQQDYGMRIYDPRVGRFLSTDPLTRSFPMLTPYQYASNRPIDGIDLDGLEYLSFHRSMYRMQYQIMTSEIAAKDGTKYNVSTARTVVNTVYENIPAELQDSKNRSFKYVGTEPVTASGRDYDPNVDGPAYIPVGKYYQKGPKFYGLADGGQDPEPTSSASGMGDGAINQGRADAANAVAGALGEEGAGVVKYRKRTFIFLNP